MIDARFFGGPQDNKRYRMDWQLPRTTYSFPVIKLIRKTVPFERSNVAIDHVYQFIGWEIDRTGRWARYQYQGPVNV